MSFRKDPHLPPGYRILLADPEVIQLLAPWGDVVFTWSRHGAAPEKVEALAWEHYEKSRKEEKS
ncbi:hypothetical protein [Rubrobacter calidifluminis]|uniref:hypothetical protein n=1 Tax=Rubrobacter calidifluminis TaxID=1392640 RepID=UPI0023626FFB|nr:hypothetical protein [Rubrobacter calidifluminis]